MPENISVSYSELEVGYEFPPVHYYIDSKKASAYLKAVTDSSFLFQGSSLVPPLAVGAFSMASLSQSIALPPGSIHISQEFEFLKTLNVGDTIVCIACVSKKQERGGMCILTMDIKASNPNREIVVTGKTTFMLPQAAGSQS